MKDLLLYSRIITLVISLLPGLLAGCTNEAPDARVDKLSTSIADLPGDTDAAGNGTGVGLPAFRPLLFQLSSRQSRLLTNAADSARYLKTADWDLAFTGNFNSEVFLNHGEVQLNPGFGGPVKSTAIVMIEKGYDDVTEAPADEIFNASKVTSVGWAAGPASSGWFFYSLNNHICVPVNNRTYVLRLADGKFAKLEIQNIYKGNPKVVTDLYWPAPYLHFRYFVQPDGSKNLKTL